MAIFNSIWIPRFLGENPFWLVNWYPTFPPQQATSHCFLSGVSHPQWSISILLKRFLINKWILYHSLSIISICIWPTKSSIELTMIPVRSQWGRYNLPRSIQPPIPIPPTPPAASPPWPSASAPPPPSPGSPASSCWAESAGLRRRLGGAGRKLGSWGFLFGKCGEKRTTLW